MQRLRSFELGSAEVLVSMGVNIDVTRSVVGRGICIFACKMCLFHISKYRE